MRVVLALRMGVGLEPEGLGGMRLLGMDTCEKCNSLAHIHTHTLHLSPALSLSLSTYSFSCLSAALQDPRETTTEQDWIPPADLQTLSEHLASAWNSSFFYNETYFANKSCQEARAWKELRELRFMDSFFTGALGMCRTLMALATPRLYFPLVHWVRALQGSG